MVRKILRFAIALVGAAIGAGIIVLVDNMIIALGATSFHISLLKWALILVYVLGCSISAIITYIFSSRILDALTLLLHKIEVYLTTTPLLEIAFAVLGLIVGLLVAFLISTLLGNLPLPWLVAPLSVLLYALFGYLGVFTAVRRRKDPRTAGWVKESGLLPMRSAASARPKILDTSVIIDGRIFDICQTGVVEGVLVVPGFVLKELRHIADSSDALKRGRGRRGLDIIQKMQKELSLPVKIEEKDYDDIPEVDLKLLKLAQDMDGVVVTNDYNLNKVAGVQNVPVFNINELANAIKPVVLPGEEMRVTLMREGTEAGQGVGYLEDGTMIVVDGGKRLIGETVDSVVTSVLQTAAGRMIFAKVK